MNTIPIILTFDNNMSFPAAVCISSMMMSAKEDTFYDFFVLHAGEPPVIVGLDKIKETYSNMRLQYRCVGDAFSGAFEIRGITEAAYYRLLSADLVPEYDKAIYADVDILFRMDLKKIYEIDLGDSYVAAVPAIGISTDLQGQKYLSSIGLDCNSYFVSGFLVMDLKKMRRDSLVPKFKQESIKKYKYQDQDILNIVCKGHITSLPCIYSMGVNAYKCFATGTYVSVPQYINLNPNFAINNSNIHYNGVKPWVDCCPNFDIWWEFYRRSPIYDHAFYFNFFYKKLDQYDQLSLMKRIKILARYFVVGKK